MADLDEYRRRRDLDATPEPPGGRPEPGERPIFVIQEHAASTRHFDLRLETQGILASWAVPKDPSTDPDDQRLAVRTEDHPLEYADFEGHIPAGQYGAGAVIVWDIGPYQSLTQDDEGDPRPVAEAIEAGHVEVWLEGEKVRGGYALTHARLGGDDDNWLLRKLADEGSDARRRPTSTEPASVVSGHTVEEVAAAARGGQDAPDLDVATLPGEDAQ